MRPLTLELAGFTAFREPVTIDFSDADYFALVGPTGSGKSSIIDAMCFALYGAVPRLDLRSVLPVISQGKQEARVRLDFAIGDRTFTAVRVVRKLGPDRATTKEARLEAGDEVLAGDADGVSHEVERLLGLGFEEFTRCVVLPQGEFARFMHDKPSARQDLLVKLLDLDIYARMAQRANQRAAVAEAELIMQRRRLEEDLAFATGDALADVTTQLAGLEDLRRRITAEEPELEQLRDTHRLTREAAEGATRAAAALEAIRVPDDVDRLAGAVTQSRARLVTAEENAEQAEAAAADAAHVLNGLPARTILAGALEAHERRATAAEGLAAVTAEVGRLEDRTAKAETLAKEAEAAAHDALHALEAARIAHRALDLARVLQEGEPCPVCRQTVATLPDIEVPSDLDHAERTSKATQQAQKKAEADLSETQRSLAAGRARAQTMADAVAVIDERLAEHPDADAVRAQLALVVEAEEAATVARTRAAESRTLSTQARKALEAAEKATARARRDLDAQRDGLAELSPPPLAREDLASDWRVLADWAAKEALTQRARARDAAEAAEAAEARGRAIVAAQQAACEEAGIPHADSPRDAVLSAVERARAQRERIELALEEVRRIGEEVAGLEERAVVAKALGGHLKANAFERWVLRQALTTLVDGATQMLLDLSNGHYSLTLDKNFNFAVIDHRNADATRSARTLSGGETFLASLALALAMSDRIAQLSANTAVRLESIFLDEGFGTLDPETLETVATAIEALGAGNRVVGIVTHVRDLAERVPVRFEVRRGPSTSTVEKVLA